MKIRSLIHIVSIFLYLLSLQLTAQDGMLDTSFGTNGIVRTDINNLYEVFKAFTVQEDGKIIVVGHTSIASTANKESIIIRYNIDGSLDTTFGGSGIIIAAFSSAFDTLNAVEVQNDGKILVAGYAGLDFLIARYTTDGQLDTSFNTNGVVFTNYHETVVGSSQDKINCITIQNDGKILVGGYAKYFSNYPYAIVRYNIDGTVDESFGIDGRTIVNHNFGISTGSKEINDILVNDEGKIYAIAETEESNNSSYNNQTIARFNSDGSIDEDFGVNGRRYFDLNTNSTFNEAVFQEDGKLVIAGNIGVRIAIARLSISQDAVLDPSFNNDGRDIPILGEPASFGKSISIQPDGKIIISGNVSGNDGDHSAIVRYLPNGDLDTTFGTSGIFNLFAGDGYQGGSFSTLQPNGELIVGGDLGDSTSSNTDLYLSRITTGILSTERFIESRLDVYPNPLMNELFIQTTNRDSDVTYKIYAIDGKEIKINDVLQLSETLTQIDVSHIAKGVYILIIEGNNTREIKKIIK